MTAKGWKALQAFVYRGEGPYKGTTMLSAPSLVAPRPLLRLRRPAARSTSAGTVRTVASVAPLTKSSAAFSKLLQVQKNAIEPPRGETAGADLLLTSAGLIFSIMKGQKC